MTIVATKLPFVCCGDPMVTFNMKQTAPARLGREPRLSKRAQSQSNSVTDPLSPCLTLVVVQTSLRSVSLH